MTLIDAKGGPAGFRWMFGEKFAGAEVGANGHFWVSSNDFALMELLSEVPEDGFRLEAEVLHDLASHDAGEVGIFVSHQLRASGPEGRPSRQLIKLTFNDYPGKKEAKGHQSFQPIFYPDAERGEANNFPGVRTQPDLPAVRPWRKLVVEATPKTILGNFDDQQTSWEWVDLNQRINQHVRTLQKIRPGILEYLKADLAFDQRGSIGIYVSLGSASFRNVNVHANKIK